MPDERNESEIDGDRDLSQPITGFHFNALSDTLRREFRATIESLEEKQDKLSEDLNNVLIGNINEIKDRMVNQIVQELWQISGDASVHVDDFNETNGEVLSHGGQVCQDNVADLSGTTHVMVL